jgi:hypothetical protein
MVRERARPAPCALRQSERVHVCHRVQKRSQWGCCSWCLHIHSVGTRKRSEPSEAGCHTLSPASGTLLVPFFWRPACFQPLPIELKIRMTFERGCPTPTADIRQRHPFKLLISSGFSTYTREAVTQRQRSVFMSFDDLRLAANPRRRSGECLLGVPSGVTAGELASGRYSAHRPSVHMHVGQSHTFQMPSSFVARQAFLPSFSSTVGQNHSKT